MIGPAGNDNDPVAGAAIDVAMEVRGLEPRTYCLQSNCSTR